MKRLGFILPLLLVACAKPVRHITPVDVCGDMQQKLEDLDFQVYVLENDNRDLRDRLDAYEKMYRRDLRIQHTARRDK